MDEINGRRDKPATGQKDAPRLRIQADGIKDPGVKRPANEDDYYIVPADQDPALLQRHGFLYVVADGVGGNKGGRRASHLAVTQLPRHYYGSPDADPAINLKLAVQKTGQDILQEANANPEIGKMGCTVAAMVVKENTLTVTHVGDARAYLMREGQLRPLTKDHTWVQQQVDSGALTEEEARAHPNRNVITRSLGSASVPSPTVSQPVPLQNGDRLLLCSDGLSGPVSQSEITAVLNRHPNPILANKELVKLANRNGGPDNIAVVVVNIGQPAKAAMPMRLLPMLGIIVALAIFLFILSLAGGSSNGEDGTVASDSDGQVTLVVETDQATAEPGQPTSTLVGSANPITTTTPSATDAVSFENPAETKPVQPGGPEATSQAPAPDGSAIVLKGFECNSVDGHEFSGGEVVKFEWEWYGHIGENEYLEIRAGLAGQLLKMIGFVNRVPDSAQHRPGHWLVPVPANEFASAEGEYNWEVVHMAENGTEITESSRGCLHWTPGSGAPKTKETATSSPNFSPPTEEAPDGSP